ncbi:MAG: hypothetical protein IT355_20010 [Gemmatimonadaceae bacterium]|nr:hypothetical protein [Gemmatimonadaceae bacterium]
MLNRLSSRLTTLHRALLLGAGLVALTVTGITLTDRADARRSVRAALADGARLDDSLSRAVRDRPGQRVAFHAAIALGYLARAELGLGSPFRLVDLARSEPRLPAAWRPRVAHAILARLASNGAAMRPRADALDIAMPSDSGAGRALLRVVDSLVLHDGAVPMTLDAIRIAAAQASARGWLRPGAVPLIDAAALLSFDRARARRDVERAITAASRGDGDLLQVVANWRGERRFSVERPLLAETAPNARRVAARLPAVLAAIDGALRTRVALPSLASSPPLAPSASRALSMLISVRTRPVQSQVRLSVLDARLVAVDRRATEQPRVTRMLLGATNEETVVMTLADVSGDTSLAPIASAAALLASQGMRTLAQEQPFHPGAVAPRPDQVALRLGLASLTFGRDVPAAWRPYYAREFAAAVDALREVFPRASFAGLNVRIGDQVLSGALAVHDPRTRTLTLPLATGFGAVGHELMHDLDWQSARDYANRQGTYATDNAWRGARSQPIAAPLARLAEFVPAGSTTNAYLQEARRPAELLARGADWFLASALARKGRVSGALSAVQDSWVRGYASAAGPVAFADHAAALSALFDVMPMLAARTAVTPRSEAEREPDLGMIARAAWFTPMPFADSLRARRWTLQGMVPESKAVACSPVARLQLAPMRETARAVAAGFIEPRVDRSLRRWARAADTTALTPEARTLRLALLGGPVDERVIDSARADWSAAAWRTLPCLVE